MRRALLLALLGVLPAAPAQAATISVARSGCGPESRYCSARLDVVAAPGEANRLTLERRPDGLLVTDAGAPPTAGAECARVDERTVRCPGILVVSIELGDGDDALSAAAALSTNLSVTGGPGDDRIEAGPGNDELAGGSGADTLAGGGGFDRLTGGEGSDALDGGDGADGVVYEGAEPVVVDLADPAPDGPASAPDTLRAVESVTAGAGDDVLRGDAGPNHLDGGDGQDRVEGRDGADHVAGGFGFDTVAAGPGDDEVEGAPDNPARDGAAARFRLDPDREDVDCGAGRDVVVEQRGDVLRACELVELYGRFLGSRARVAPSAFTLRRAVFRFPCERRSRRDACRAELLLKQAGDLSIVRRRVRWVPGEPVRVRLDPIKVPRGVFPLQVTLRYAVVAPDADYDTLTYVTPVRARKP